MHRARLPLLAALSIGMAFGVRAQDIHFTQFFHTPLATSPGLIGAFDGDHRVHAIFRQQWRAVTRPYRTFGLGYDAANAFGRQGLGVGLWLFNDNAGDSRLNTFQLGVGPSWTLAPGHGPHAITAGLQLGFTALSLNDDQLSFDAQYNGFYHDPSLATNEDFQRASLVHPDLHAGVAYRFRPAPRQLLQAGLGLFNLTRPRIGFLGSPPEPLDLRTTFHLTGQLPLSTAFDLLPTVQYMAQGRFRELLLGAMLRYILIDRFGTLRAVRIGGSYRAADAGTIYAGLEYDDWTAGLSYDINTSDLVPASRNRGGFEVTVTRVFRRRPSVPARFKACPHQL